MQVLLKARGLSTPRKLKWGWFFLALRRAKSLEISRVYFLLDALEVIDAINGVEDYSISTFILDILALLGSFENAHFYYISRTMNGVVHRIAKWGQIYDFLLLFCNGLFPT